MYITTITFITRRSPHTKQCKLNSPGSVHATHRRSSHHHHHHHHSEKDLAMRRQLGSEAKLEDLHRSVDPMDRIDEAEQQLDELDRDDLASESWKPQTEPY